MSAFHPLQTIAAAATVLPMFSLLITLMFGALAPPASGSSFDVPVELVKPEVAAARVAACGFKSVRPKFDGMLQEDVVEVLDVTSAPAKQLRCVALASLQSHYYVIFPDPLQHSYQNLYWRMARERGKAEARAWLAKRGLLSRLPKYDVKHPDEKRFARKLERLCGPKAAGSLEPRGGIASIKKGALGAMKGGSYSQGKLDEETFWCLLNAATASGYSLGFVGNAYQPRL